MTKADALEVLKQLDPTEKVRLIIDLPRFSVDSAQSADYHVFWLKNEFCSPWKTKDYIMSDGSTFSTEYILDSNGKNIELDCIQLVGSNFNTAKMDSFDFACWYNDITNSSIESETPQYTQEQQDAMWELHYETTQQNHVAYLDATKGI